MASELFRNYRVTYLEDRAIFPGSQNLVTRLWLALGAILVLVPPLVLPQYWVYTLNLAGIAIVGAHGLNLLTGYSGQISLAHASFIAIGAYTAAKLSALGVPFPIVLVAAGTAAALIGCVMAFPALRLKGLYLALASLAFYVIVDFAIRKAEPLTGGAVGTHVPPPTLLGWTVAGDTQFYYLILAVVVLSTLFAKNLERTRIGRAYMAVRDSDIAASMAGISLFRTKMSAFAVSSFYGGLAGALLGYYLQFVNPDNFGLGVSIGYIAMIIVGGMGTILGSVLGALFMTFLPEAVRVGVQALAAVMPALDVQAKGAFVEGGVYGLVIILFLMFRPEGLARMWRDVAGYFRTWPFTYS